MGSRGGERNRRYRQYVFLEDADHRRKSPVHKAALSKQSDELLNRVGTTQNY